MADLPEESPLPGRDPPPSYETSQVLTRASRDAILAAVQSRTQPSPETTPKSVEQLRAESGQRTGFYRVINSHIIDKTAKRDQALRTIDTLITLTDNIISNPNEQKYRSVKLRNPTIKRDVVDVNGGTDYLHLCKFASVRRDFQEFLVFPDSPNPAQWSALKLGNEILKTAKISWTESSESMENLRKKEEEEEEERKVKAMLKIKEDREAVRVRAERESLARRRRASGGGSTAPATDDAAGLPGAGSAE